MPDILVFGATGLTGTLITRYLLAHPEHSNFTFGIAGRSKSKLEALLSSLSKTEADIPVVVVDVTKQDDVDAAVRQAKVIINTVGPYWRWGTPVVRSCVKNNVHYVDLTGETPWTKEIIREFHYAAIKSKTVVIPSSGMDSMPSDLSVYLSNRSLKEATLASGAPSDIDTSVSAFNIRGGISAGTLSTAFTLLEEVPKDLNREARKNYSISPVVGTPYPRPRSVYSLYVPDTAKKIWGAFFFMSPVNTRVVQRSWGLLQQPVLAAAEVGQEPNEVDKKSSYGPNLVYDEFMQVPGPISAFIFSLGLGSLFGALLFPPFRWVFKKLFGTDGIGGLREDATLEKGYVKLTNVTKSVTTPEHPKPTIVKTTINGKGDPGYLLTAVMISEAALSLLPNSFSSLPPIGQHGGVLTPASALGDVLVERLNRTDRFQIESRVITDAAESKKTA